MEVLVSSVRSALSRLLPVAITIGIAAAGLVLKTPTSNIAGIWSF
jgi:hypothetical protein